MITNLRDAEIHIKRLEREIETLKKDFRNLANKSDDETVTQSNSVSATQTKVGTGRGSLKISTADLPNLRKIKFDPSFQLTYFDDVNQADAEVSADGTTIFHKLKHIFRDITTETGGSSDHITARVFEIYDPSITVPNSHGEGWNIQEVQAGEPLTELSARQMVFSDWEGHIYLIFQKYSAYPPGDKILLAAKTFEPYADNTMILGDASKRFQAIHVSTIRVNQIEIQPNAAIVIWNDTTSNWESGVNTTTNIITSFQPTFTVLNYKDHSGVNQSMNVVTNFTLTSASAKFLDGIRVT